MDVYHVGESEQKTSFDKAPNPSVRKGRRGLAKKKTNTAQDTSSSITTTCTTTTHNTSVYTSCVSRGYQSILGEINSTQDILEVEESNHTTAVTKELHEEVTETSSEGQKDEEICEYYTFEEEDNAPSTSGPNSLRSPTPPPSVGLSQPKMRRMNRKLSSALKTLNRAKGNLTSTPSTPFTKARRKRGKRSYYQDMDASTIQPEDSSLLAKTEMLIKVRYLSSIHRLQLRLTDQFHNLLTHLSRETGQEEQYLSLYLNDQVLPLTKTPKEVGLTVADIIECHCIKDAKGSDSGSESICLLIQCSNSKRKTELNVTTRQPFKDVLEKYAEQVGINASSYSLCFDGEDVGPNDTPLSLEMEDGDILDLVPASKHGVVRSAWENSVITIL